MLDKVIQERSKLHHKVNGCLSQIMEGYHSKYQLFHNGKTYCCNSQLYCPLQYGQKTMKECNYKELYKSMSSKP